MRKLFLLICCATAMFPLIGCSGGSEQGTVATTDEDEMAEYERIINEGEGEGEEDQVEEQ
ncbi:MAG: hypothetical protein ACR2NZ_01310 [Rubripirellula sp.]